jgi:hypothetical protein
MKQRKAVTQQLRQRYAAASKKQKHTILDEFCSLTSYNRSYACWLLNQPLHKTKACASSRKLTKQSPRPSRKKYDGKVLAALTKIWMILDCLCGKRLAPILKEIITVLERHHELQLDDETRTKLQHISAATIDRRLAAQRQKFQLKAKSRTKPGTLLKKQIPIRTFADWNEQQVGFVEIDLVAHDGGTALGDYAQTLDVTDVKSGWTVARAVPNKAQVWVFAALKQLRHSLPFVLRGIDSDNGSEFINDQLLRYCEGEKITFTRGRAYKKNDNCYIEQKNYTVVRRAVGYVRYDDERQVKLLNELYEKLNLYTNYFQPVMKLASKERVGAQVKKHYDKARTPYARVLEAEEVSPQQKQKLRREYLRLNPAHLKREISRRQVELLESVEKKDQQRLQAKAQRALERLSGQGAEGGNERTFV